MSHINKIKTSNGQEYDVQDKRIIEVSAEDVGKVLTVESDGSLAFKTPAPSGGIKLYKHMLRIPREGTGPLFLEVLSVSNIEITIANIEEEMDKILSLGFFMSFYGDSTEGLMCYKIIKAGMNMAVECWSVLNHSSSYVYITDITSDTVTEL